MENNSTKIRRLFGEQLISKHKLKLIVPNNDSSDSLFELFLNELNNQLNKKLIKQDEQLFKETNQNSPLFIQRKQLLKDIQDLNILNQRKDFRAIQLITQRVLHMSMFSTKQNQSIPIPAPTIKSLSSSCSYWILCNELVQRLNWPSELFAPEYNRCYCKTCYPLTKPNIYQLNNGNQYPIIIPRNWAKFALKVDEVQAKLHQIWDKWAISYHGTLPNAALSMIKHRQICLPGDKLFDGTPLTIRSGHIPNQNAFFTSPTIRYAAQNHYSTPIEFRSEIDKNNYSAKIVLRCRQMPNTFTIQGETLNNCELNSNDYCDFISDEQIEWKTDQRGTVIFDGLCVKLKKIINQTQIHQN